VVGHVDVAFSWGAQYVAHLKIPHGRKFDGRGQIKQPRVASKGIHVKKTKAAAEQQQTRVTLAVERSA
jgi:hypothetical protein